MQQTLVQLVARAQGLLEGRGVVWSVEVEQADTGGAETGETLRHLVLDARLRKISTVKRIHFGCDYTLHTGGGGGGGGGRGGGGERREGGEGRGGKKR